MSSHRQRLPSDLWAPRQELAAEFRLAVTQPEYLTERQVELSVVRRPEVMATLESLQSASEKAPAAWKMSARAPSALSLRVLPRVFPRAVREFRESTLVVDLRQYYPRPLPVSQLQRPSLLLCRLPSTWKWTMCWAISEQLPSA